MGASNSKMEEDKALQLCRERKKFVKQALDGRCSLAAAHAMYIQSLKNTGTALRKFVDPGAPIESSLYTSTNATPEPLVQTEKSLSHFSFSSPSVSQRIDAAETFSPSPSPPSSTLFQENHMKFRGSFSKKVEEKPPVPVTGTVTSSSTPQTITPRSTGKPEASPFEASSLPPQTPPWDYFGFFHPIDNQFSIQEGKEMNQGFENNDDMSRLREEEGIPELEDEDEKDTFHGREESQDSEDEFDEPPTDTLVRSFENLNRVHHCVEASASPILPSATSKTDLLNGKKSDSPDLLPLRATSSVVAAETDSNKTPVKEDCMESKVARKDFFSSMKDIEYLFIKAHESGQEIPRMLEANKLHFRPIFPAKESGSISSTFLKACFSCGEDPSHVQEENPQAAVKYLTWHRTTSSRSSSSRNPLGANSKDDIEDLTGNLFDNFCMISGSHASTLDRLYAWERKLYDEVKASEMVRRDYDFKCKILRQLESKGESPQKIDKTRAVVKDLHSRIRVAIHRIDSISKRIEDLRDKELQPQLEELIAGLSRMWEGMSECHRLQLRIISIADINGNTKISVSELRRQITIHLEDELNCLSSSFMKWVGAQKSYLQSINGWLLKCVSFPQKSSRKKRRPQGIPLQYFGPPIYVMCGVWLDKLDGLPSEELVDSIKNLAAEASRFLPRQEKKEGKDANQSDIAASWKHDNGSESAVNFLRDEVSQDGSSGFVQFKESLLEFCGKLNNFAESSVEMYTQLQEDIQHAKIKYDQFKSQSAV